MTLFVKFHSAKTLIFNGMQYRSFKMLSLKSYIPQKQRTGANVQQDGT